MTLCAVALCVLAAGPAQAATRILVFGDSLSAAHGIPRDAGWVALLQKRLAKNHDDAQVTNASISGETSAGGLARLPAALKRVQPDIVVLELGANDGLQALPLQAMRRSLVAMIKASRGAGAKVLLLGMRIPTNYGKTYSEHFHAVFNAIAKRYKLAYVPFFLAPIATDRSRFQADGIHPKAEAEPVLLDQIWPVLGPMIAGNKRSTTMP